MNPFSGRELSSKKDLSNAFSLHSRLLSIHPRFPTSLGQSPNSNSTEAPDSSQFSHSSASRQMADPPARRSFSCPGLCTCCSFCPMAPLPHSIPSRSSCFRQVLLTLLGLVSSHSLRIPTPALAIPDPDDLVTRLLPPWTANPSEVGPTFLKRNVLSRESPLRRCAPHCGLGQLPTSAFQ